MLYHESTHMSTARDATLVFLVKRTPRGVSHICLGMKKRGFGAGRWNGVGGKVEKDETLEGAAAREAREEFGIETGELSKVGELLFNFPHSPSWDLFVHAYLCTSWKGEPRESDEMAPKWFPVGKIPYDSMWPDDKFWLPQVLAGGRVKANFVFGEGDVIRESSVELVKKF